MFGLLAKLLGSIATFLFPVFASYKALKANDPAQLQPWLMYWVVIACVLVIESWTGWLFSWLPFFQEIRAGFMLWLVLPQTQGATKLYLEYVHPVLTQHETEIEEFISQAHDQAKAAGIQYLRKLIRYVRDVIYGTLTGEPMESRGRRSPSPPASRDPSSYVKNLFSRWQIPALAPFAPPIAGDFMQFVSTALQDQPADAPKRGTPGGNPTLIPANIESEADKAKFIALQRERLKQVMAALELEMASVGGPVSAGMPDAAGLPGFFRSPSQGNISGHESDFDHVNLSDTDNNSNTSSPAPKGAQGPGWFGWSEGQKTHAE
ncbi:hypothetical protein RUND412_000068 [Rhizina undulata]